MLIEVLIFVFSLIFIIYLYLIWKYNYWKRYGIIGPKPSLLLGNTPNVLLQSQSVTIDIQNIYDKYKESDKFIGYFMLTTPKLLLIDPNFIRDVVIKDFKYFQKNGGLSFVDVKIDPLLGRNPFVLTGTEWKEKRSEVTPALTVSRIKASFPIILNVCDKMTKYLENEIKISSKSGFNGRDTAARFTMEVVANCIYGVDADAFLSSKKSEMMKMGQSLFDESFLLFFFAILNSFPCLKSVFNKPLIPKKSQDYFIGLMEHAIKLRKESKIDRTDFLNYLLQLAEKKNLSTIEMAAHTMTFFLDGFETSSMLISNCLYLLGQNKNVQEKLREQIKNGLQNCTESSDIFDLVNDLPYLDQVINETLRLLPPVAMIEKICTEPYDAVNVKGEKIKFRINETLSIPLYSIQRNEKYYPEPEKFIPERFDKENGGIKKYKDMGVFLPFGDGPRACLGQKFGILQSKTAIFELVKNWQISLNEKTLKQFEPDPKSFFVLPKGGTWLDFERIV